MPAEAKLGLVLGIALTIACAIFFRPKEHAIPVADHAIATGSGMAQEIQGQVTSQRK